MDADELRRNLRAHLKTRRIEVPGVPGEMLVRELTSLALIDFQGDGSDNPRELLERMIGGIIAGTINDDGSPAFDDPDATREVLREQLTEEQLTAWFRPILELSGIFTEADEKKPLAPVASSPTA